MPRQMRKRSRTGIYHVMIRGNSGQSLFEYDEDNQRFLEILAETKEKMEFEIDVFAYCLMGNHVHLLLRENDAELGDYMRRSSAKYAQWFNIKYVRKGHVFQERYKSEPVENDAYLLTVFRYILQNPMKAKLSTSAFDYRWSSWKAYEMNAEYPTGLTDCTYMTNMFGKSREEAINKMKEFLRKENNDSCLDIETGTRLTDDELRIQIRSQYPEMNFRTLNTLNKKERNEALRKLKAIDGAAIRQIARVTGLGLRIVHDA